MPRINSAPSRWPSFSPIRRSPVSVRPPLALKELTTSVGQIGIIEPIVCRQDLKTGLVYVIARKKQERSMVTQFKKYRDQQAKTAAREKNRAKSWRENDRGRRLTINNIVYQVT